MNGSFKKRVRRRYRVLATIWPPRVTVRDLEEPL